MKAVYASAFALMVYASPSLACNAQGVNYYGHAMKDALNQYAYLAQYDNLFSWSSGQAAQVAEISHHIGDHGYSGDCADAVNDFYRELEPYYYNLHGQIDARIPYSNNMNLVGAWRQVEFEFQNLGVSITQ